MDFIKQVTKERSQPAYGITQSFRFDSVHFLFSFYCDNSFSATSFDKVMIYCIKLHVSISMELIVIFFGNMS